MEICPTIHLFNEIDNNRTILEVIYKDKTI